MDFNIKISKRKSSSIRICIQTGEKEMTVFGTEKNLSKIVGGIVFKFYKQRDRNEKIDRKYS